MVAFVSEVRNSVDRVELVHGINRALASESAFVVLTRGLALSASELQCILAELGTLRPPRHYPAGDDRQFAHWRASNISIVSNVRHEGQPIGHNGSAELAWHSDQPYAARPPQFGALYAVETPSEGGLTSFMDMTAIYESVPAYIHRSIDGRSIVHYAGLTSAGVPRNGAVADVVFTGPGISHPIIQRMPMSGRPFLFLGRRRNAVIAGLPTAESDQLLDLLWNYCGPTSSVFAQAWQPGDLLIWNNQCLLHHRSVFPDNERRVLLGGQFDR
jgi:taurine dioxygenase